MTTRRILYAFLALLVAAATFFANPTSAGSVAAPAATSVVKIVLDGGHGSGVHIGDGYIVTAAHVVDGVASAMLKTSDGHMRNATVLWSNKEYDVALLRASPTNMASSKLACRALHEGDQIRADGNPLALEFVSSYGKISGGARKVGNISSVYITDMTTVMGMSGGPVFSPNGEVVGIVSAVAIAPLKNGMAWVPALTGFGMAVPSFEVCNLMGREVK